MQPKIEITKLKKISEAETCARMMAHSEPWLTLNLNYDDCMRTLTSSPKEIYLAISENEIAGFILLNMQGAFIGYIQAICVSAESRGKGIGSALISFAEKRIFSESPNVFLCVSSFNSRAQKLYKSLGYEIIGELKNYLVAGYSEILMRKTLYPIVEFNRLK